MILHNINCMSLQISESLIFKLYVSISSKINISVCLITTFRKAGKMQLCIGEAQLVKNPRAMWETPVWFLCWENPPENW